MILLYKKRFQRVSSVNVRKGTRIRVFHPNITEFLYHFLTEELYVIKVQALFKNL